MLTDMDTVRLNLRDVTEPHRFSDEHIDYLLKTGSVEAASAMGWMLIAAEAADATVSASVGNTSESWGQPTERFRIATAMHNYWKALDPARVSDGVALWYEVVPAEETGIIGELYAHREYIETLVA